MPHAEQIGAQRWYAVPDDMSALGSWCVMNVPKTPVIADPDAGEYQIARYLSPEEAEQMAHAHNAGLAGRPEVRHRRYRVRPEDVLVFDELGEILELARTLLAETEREPEMHPFTEIRYLRAVLTRALAALELLTEGVIRLRAETEEVITVEDRL